MKHWPPPSPAPQPYRPRRVVPCFHPVPVGARADGWTAERQAAFIGHLAETRSVVAACRRIGMGRESAYRLRKRAGAAGFAAAWDAAMGTRHEAVDLASAKSTGLDPGYRSRVGLARVVLVGGRYAGTVWKDDDSALLSHLARLDRACREWEV
jgi:hypothetical protein